MKRAAALTLILCAAVTGPTARSAGPLRFTDRTAPAGFDLQPDIGGHHGSYVADYDGDGDEDIFMTSHGIFQDPDTGWNALFRNRGDGTFDEVAGSLRLAGETAGATPLAGVALYGRYTRELHGATWFDFDNDGDFDLYEPDTDSDKAVAGPARHGYDELYENDGDGSFTRVSTERGFAPLDRARRGAVALDIDRDGFLDLFVLQMIDIVSGTHVVPSPYRSVYFNQGGTFCLEGTPGCRPATGIGYTGWSQGVTTIDYDLDGDVDILEASEFNPDGLRLWENDGAGRFQDVAPARGLPGPGASVNCVVTGDVDNDGDSDVYTWFEQNGRVGRLYRNEIECRPDVQTGCSPATKGKRFTLVNSSLGGAEHMFFGDLDNDGDLDLVSGGVLLNNGNGTFVADTTTGLLARGRGGMVLDADGDGDLDVVMNHSDRTYPYRGFYRNDLDNGFGFLKVKLTGRGGQAGAPGARVWVYEEGFLGDRLHLLGYREVVTATGGFVSGPSPIQHFGLGNRVAVDVRVAFVTGETVVRASVAENTQLDVRAEDTPAPTNEPPVVDAGPDQAVTLPESAALDGTVSDDGRPDPPGAVTTGWTQVNGPAPVAFADAASVDTTVHFSAAGSYRLRLTASDGEKTGSDEVSITVDESTAVLPLYGVFERTFTQSGGYSNPYLDASATATFTSPDGRVLTAPLFWDGGDTWTVRFSPDVTGTWSYRTDSNDAGLEGRTGVFEAGAAASRGGIRRRSASPYHFERQDGTPFWWMGDTLWRGFGRDAAEGLDRSSFIHYLDVRSGQGFNYVHASLMDPGENEGGPVFESVTDETLNPAYFREVDARVRAMNARGITAGIVLAWGSGIPSWESFTSDDARRRYARYVVARYGAYDVVFIVSGEWNEGEVPRPTFIALGREIDDADPHGRLVGIHGTGLVEDFAGEAWMSFGDYQQVYSTLHQGILAARVHGKPVVNAEYAYYLRDQDGDGVVDKPNSATLAEIRHATWDIAMAGGYFVSGWGTTYLGGLRDVGPFNPDDPRNDDWEEDVQHVRNFFARVRSWTLEPADALLTGPGVHYALARSGQQYVAYARNANGPLSLSLGGAMAGTYAVRRFDPRTGASVPLPAYSGSGPVTLSPPDSQDWAFVLSRSGRYQRRPAPRRGEQ
jgi:hypothetical protein